MNPDQLLKYFERISEAPDAISRLRRFILDLAVRGKLVEQDPNDEPASELLKRIQAEKARLVKAGKGSKEKLLSPVGEDIDFNIPSAWVWTRLGIVTSYIQRGKSPKYATSNGSLVVSQKCVQWWGLDLAVAKQVTLESLDDYESIRFLRSGDLLWNSTGTGTIGRVVRLVDPPNKLVCDSHVTVVRCMGVDPEYIRIWLRSDHVYALIEDRAAGSTNQVELTAQMAINQIVPLPPLAEQNRIVAKVDELMNLCNKLEAAKAEREKNRDRLVSVSLQRLNQPSDDEDIFRDNSRFIFDNLPRLTTRPAHIKQLRQTILNLAVRGKLVPQDPNDEPARKLVESIEKQKKCLLREGKLNKSKECRHFNNDSLPHNIPISWAWAVLGEITNIGTGSTPSRTQPTFWESGSIPWITSGSTSQFFITEADELITEEAVKAHRLRLYEPGTLLVALYGQGKTRGQVATLGIKAAINQACAAICLIAGFESIEAYLKLFLQKNYEEVRTLSAGGTQPNLNVQKIKELLVPIPPLTEQHRIVAKVDELMTICDKLEAQLTITEADNRRLLEAVLHEALSPALAEV
jgi:type I restriction enzyme, S subunit